MGPWDRAAPFSTRGLQRFQYVPDGGRIGAGQCDFFIFVTEYEMLPFAQGIGCRNGSDFDVQELSSIRHRKVKLCFRWSFRPEAQSAVIVAQTAETVSEDHPGGPHRCDVTSEEEHRQDHIGLLDHLMAVDVQRDNRFRIDDRWRRR